MVILNKGETSENIVLTLTEKSTLTAPTYYLVCTNVSTKSAITIDLGDDLSPYTTRYNEFNINPSVVFAGEQHGQWLYKAFEYLSDVEVENGKLLLKNSTDFNFTGYDEATTYSGYAG